MSLSDSGMENSSNCPSYWTYVDNVLLKYTEDIKLEKQLIAEIKYSSPNSTIQFSTGISSARGFEPVFKMTGSSDVISLMDVDWYDFIANINIMPDNDKEKRFVETVVEFENLKLSSQLIEDRHILVVRSGEAVLYFDDECIKDIINIKHLIQYRLEYLHFLDFKNFYNNALLYITNCDGCSIETCINKLMNLCCLNKCEQSYCLLEYITFNQNLVLSDIEKVYDYHM